MQTAPLTRTTLTETTIDTILGLRVGVGSLWDVDGQGPTAMVAVADSQGAQVFRKRLRAGESFSVNGHTFHVAEVVVLKSTLGHVVLEHASP